MDDLFAKPKPAEPKALSVTQLLRRIKNVIEVQVGELWIEGEVSNLKKQASGHWYFSLKDEGAQIQCAMFGARKRQGHEALEDGAKVRVFAEASVYEARGQLQIIVQKAERAGLGDLQARFEALKRKLHAEGLFDAERKKPLPKFPRLVGIVTSDTGAAIRDILNVIERRAPWVQPVLMPVRVQGKGAEFEIARAIERMANPEQHGIPRCDVLIVGRGGGSIEDLWCFNEEIVARAIAASVIPIISAVGHEIDFTIADFVADLRAPTPSAAAELAVPDGAELIARLTQMGRRMNRQVLERLLTATRALDALKRGPLQRGGERLLREPSQRVDSLRARLDRVVAATLDAKAASFAEARANHRAHHPAKVLERRTERVAVLGKQLLRLVSEGIETRQRRLAHVAGLLRTLGPDSAFQRGFTITLDEQGHLIRSATTVVKGSMILTRFADGEVSSVVNHDTSP
ncbi:exodeoxyribonuclease VII large subunit [Luteolibacter ambystomatis]|uniref:Exodeoxyribonuclease 7 large subunit n=1 Tax=Luteolibacter ambystomatis TaxID=2824561 RepID=A0A975IYM8_9BACT|nr:exodeoxyribonuclease VII large subunit [Luteolibacter ambystomatis]QUE50053.1 exodeoxyribonuclease VII large subunit [Luteolibacter ambystomatis]